MTSTTAARLAELPPQRWEAAKVRMASLERFLAQDDRSTRTIRRHAADLGISRAMFYKLIAIEEQWASDGRASREPRPRRPRDEVGGALVEEAIALCGPGAIQERVYKRALEIAAHRGLAAPARKIVRTLHNRLPSGAAMGERLGVSAAAVVDAAPLALRVRHEGGQVLTVLNAVVDRQGVIVDRLLTPGRADDDVLERLCARAKERVGMEQVLASCAFDEEARVRCAVQGVDQATGRAVRRGAAIVAALGTRIGRIAVRPWATADDPTDEHPTVDFEDARAVVEFQLPIS